MASISIRRLDDHIVDRLRARAESRGVSMEEEARRILAAAVAAPENAGQFALSLFGTTHGEETDLEIPTAPPGDPIDFSSEDYDHR